MASIDPPSDLDEEVFFGPVTQRELIITWRKRRQERMKKERDEALKEKECALSREEPDVKKPHIQLEERKSDLKITDDEQLSDICSNSNGKAGQASDHQPQGTETSCTIDMECAGNNIFEIGLNSENETKETSSVQEVSINEHLSGIQNDVGSVIDSSKPEDISACSTSNNYVETAEDHHQLDTKTIGTPRMGANCVAMPFTEEASLREKCPNLGMPADNYLQFQSTDEVCSSFEEESVVEDDSFHIDRNSCVGNVSKEVPLSEEVSINADTSEVQEELYPNCKLEVSECLLRELDETPANEKSEEYEDAMEDSYQHDTESVHPPSKEASYSGNDSPIKTCPELHERELQRDALQALIETVSHPSGIVPNEEKESPVDINLKLCGISVEVAESVHQNAVTDQEQSKEESSIDGISILNSDIEQNESVSGSASIELDHHKSECISTEEPIWSFTGSLGKSEDGRPGFDNDRPSHNSYRVFTSLEGECGVEDHASHVEQVCVENASKDTLLTVCEPGESQCLLREVEETLACDKSENYEDAAEEYRQSSDVSIQSPTKEADYSTKDITINKKSVEFENNESEPVAEQVLVLPGVNSSVVQNGEDESSTHVKSESYDVLVEGSDNGRPSHNCDRACTSLEKEGDAEDHASHIEQVGVENSSKEVPFVECVSFTANMSEIQQELISRPIVVLTNYETGESQYLLREAEETLDKSENFEDAVEEHRQPNDLSLQSPTNIVDYSSKDVSINNTSKSVEFEDSEPELVAEQVIVVPAVHLSGVQKGEDEPSTHVKSESYDMVEEYCQSNDVSMQSPTNKADYSSKDVSVSKNSVEFEKNEPELVAEQVLVVPGGHLSGVVQNGGDESSNYVESESYDMVEDVGHPTAVVVEKTSAEDISVQDVPCASQDPEVRELSKGQTSFDFAYENGTRQMQRNQNLNNSCAQQQVSTKDDVPINRDPEENKENGPALMLHSPTIMPEVRPDKMIGTPLAGTSTSGCSKSGLTALKSNIPKPSILKPATLNVDPSSLNTTWVKRLNMSKIPKPKRPCYVQPFDTL